MGIRDDRSLRLPAPEEVPPVNVDDAAPSRAERAISDVASDEPAPLWDLKLWPRSRSLLRLGASWCSKNAGSARGAGSLSRGGLWPVLHVSSTDPDRGRRDAGSRGQGLERRGTSLFGGRLRSPDHNRRPRRVLPRRRSQPPHGGALQGLGSITGSGGRKSQAVGRVPGATVPEGAREAVLRTSRPTSSARPNVDSVPLRRRWPHGTSTAIPVVSHVVGRAGPARWPDFRRESPRPLPDRVSSRL